MSNILLYLTIRNNEYVFIFIIIITLQKYININIKEKSNNFHFIYLLIFIKNMYKFQKILFKRKNFITLKSTFLFYIKNH